MIRSIIISFFLLSSLALAQTTPETPSVEEELRPTVEEKPKVSPIGGSGVVQPPQESDSPVGGSSGTDAAPIQTGQEGAVDAGATDAGAATGGQTTTFSFGPGLKPPSESTDEPDLEQKISLDLRSIDVLDVLRFLAIKGNLNIVGGKNVVGSVTLLLNNITLQDALDIILSINRLAYTMKGNIVHVMTEEEYKALYGKQFYDRRVTKIYRLRFASAKNVGAMLENVKSSIGRIVYDDSTGTVVIMDTPETIEEMEEVIRHEELPTVTRIAPTETEIFELQYAKVDKLSEKITPLLSEEIGKMYIDDRTNKIVISDLPHKLKEFGNIIQAFDAKTREVFIEAKIIQIELKNEFKSGIDWASFFSGTLQASFPLSLTSFFKVEPGTLRKTTTTSGTTTTTTFAGTGVIIKMLETFGRTNILSTPYIAAISGQQAKIMVGTKEAYTTSSVTQSQATTTTAQSVAFIDVGVTLTVTPEINEEDYVTLKIKPEVSSVNRFLTTSQGDQVPIVETTNAETTVLVKDGASVLIGGLMKTTRTKTRSGLPVLSRIPVVGGLFRASDERATTSELIVILTPHLMSGEETLPGTKPANIAEIRLPPMGNAEDSAVDAMIENIPPTAAPKGEENRWERKHRWK